MPEVYVIGTACTAFGKKSETSFKALTREAYLAVVADAGIEDGRDISMAWFANCGMGLVRTAQYPRTGLFLTPGPGGAVSGARPHNERRRWLRNCLPGISWRLEGHRVGRCPAFTRHRCREDVHTGRPCTNPGDLRRRHRSPGSRRVAHLLCEAGKICGMPFAPGEKRGTIFMDTYAMQAAYHMKRYGTTQRTDRGRCRQKPHPREPQSACAIPFQDDGR